MDKNTGGPAFPVPMFAIERGKYEAEQQGISMRDYFAANAPPPPDHWRGGERDANGMASWAYRFADAMLAEREK